MTILRFSISGDTVRFGARERKKIFSSGCNEPYKNRHWCPKKKWFNKEPCPFLCQRECENYLIMCGRL